MIPIFFDIKSVKNYLHQNPFGKCFKCKIYGKVIITYTLEQAIKFFKENS